MNFFGNVKNGISLKHLTMMSQVRTTYRKGCVALCRIRRCHNWLSCAIRSRVMADHNFKNHVSFRRFLIIMPQVYTISHKRVLRKLNHKNGKQQQRQYVSISSEFFKSMNNSKRSRFSVVSKASVQRDCVKNLYYATMGNLCYGFTFMQLKSFFLFSYSTLDN